MTSLLVSDFQKSVWSVPSIPVACPWSNIVFCCYNYLYLPWEKFSQVWVTCFPSSWEQENSVEKRLCKFEAKGWEFVTFSNFKTLFLLERTGKKKLSKYGTNPENYSNRMFFFSNFSSYVLRGYYSVPSPSTAFYNIIHM